MIILPNVIPTSEILSSILWFAQEYTVLSYFIVSGWDFYKLKLNNVFLLDFFGGATHVPLEDYFEAKP